MESSLHDDSCGGPWFGQAAAGTNQGHIELIAPSCPPTADRLRIQLKRIHTLEEELLLFGSSFRIDGRDGADHKIREGRLRKSMKASAFDIPRMHLYRGRVEG